MVKYKDDRALLPTNSKLTHSTWQLQWVKKGKSMHVNLYPEVVIQIKLSKK
jgi:hypothetical protein